MRFIRLNLENIVISERVGSEIVEGEIQSDIGYCGQKRLEDGTFIDVPIVTPDLQPTNQEIKDELETIKQGIMDAFIAICDIGGM